jgi:endoribonuclease Dicer
MRNGLRMQRNRTKRFPPGQKMNRPNYNQNDPDALCSILFCNSKFITKILYTLFYELSKSDPELRYINAQYTVDKVADPITESKEAEAEHRKQEEVLKRFRMHECNLLIGTSVLEEGIDLPKCNLVIRWDAPKSYRSYVHGKGKARAAQAYHVIFVTPNTHEPIQCVLDRQQTELANEFLSHSNHRYICDKVSDFQNDNPDCAKHCVTESEQEDNRSSIVKTNHSEAMKNSTEEMIDKIAIYMYTEKVCTSSQCSTRIY